MPSLPQELIEMIEDRIADPRRRHFSGENQHHGASSDPEEIKRFLNDNLHCDDTRGVDPFDAIRQQMTAWGQPMPKMFLTSDAQGSRGASTSDPDYPIARPASESDLARLEARIGRPLPEDLRQMFGVANGGWGPGYSFTPGHGPGLHSVEGMILELDDLERRGPGYTSEMAWPGELLPLTDLVGTASYNLDTGAIVQFDDHWYDHDKTIETAFATSHPSLEDFLREWVAG